MFKTSKSNIQKLRQLIRSGDASGQGGPTSGLSHQMVKRNAHVISTWK